MLNSIARKSLPTPSEMNQLVAVFNAGRHAEVEEIALAILTQHSRQGVAWKLLGAALQAQGKEALSASRRATELLPGDAEAFDNLGIALRNHGLLADAAKSHRSALRIKPKFAKAHNNLGVVLHCLGQYDEAIASYRKALAIEPVYGEAHSNLGVSLQRLGQLDQSVESYLRALEINPHNALAHNNLGNALQTLGYLDVALTCCRRALAIDPDFVDGHVNLGTIFQSLGQFDDAIASYGRALVLNPCDVKAIYNLSHTMFSIGRLSDAWAQYEQRFDERVTRKFAQPCWSGEDLGGKSILIWAEQGIGDEIMFASMHAEIVERSGRCVIECQNKLVPLFGRTFPRAQVVAKAVPPHPDTQEGIDYQCAAGSLGRWLRPTLESFPPRHGFLTPDPDRVMYWQGRLAATGPGPKIGFCWRSMLVAGSRALQYTTLDQWGPIFKLSGVHFVNLQYDKCDAELDAARQQFGVPLHAFSEVDLLNDLDESAALTQALDLVISAGTATCVMSAALGVPTWLLGTGTDWTTLGTDHTPWFPTQRSFSRQWNQPWSEIIEAVAQQLELTTGQVPSGDGEKHAE